MIKVFQHLFVREEQQFLSAYLKLQPRFTRFPFPQDDSVPKEMRFYRYSPSELRAFGTGFYGGGKFMDGKANFIGVFGLTGGFRGWFSDDAERVPIIAKLNVLVGSVTLELKEWKHGNWNPPKGKDD